MRPRLLLALALLACGSAAHAGCQPKEYAQVKDDARTDAGRHFMAIRYCTAHGLEAVDLQYQDFKGADACRREKEQIMDALTAAKDRKAVAFAMNGCHEDRKP